MFVTPSDKNIGSINDHSYLLLPPSQKECDSKFGLVQTTLSLAKLKKNIIKVYEPKQINYEIYFMVILILTNRK